VPLAKASLHTKVYELGKIVAPGPSNHQLRILARIHSRYNSTGLRSRLLKDVSGENRNCMPSTELGRDLLLPKDL
jgi:hypothetical protein